jgi:NADH dehydrogenase FAD-containing subunit
MVVAPNINVVRRGVLIGFTTKLGSGFGGVWVVRNLNQSLALPAIATRVVGIFQMVFTNPITTTHVNKTIDQPMMN